MSVNIKIYNQKAETIGKKQVNAKIFGLELQESLVHQAVVAQRANMRQVLTHTKGRAEVRGGGKKPWQQKGTGRARAGSNRSPLWKGGGVTFGPNKNRNYKKNINKKMKRNALFMLLSDRLKDEQLYAIDKLEIKEFKTKVVDNILQSFERMQTKKEKRSFLIINDLSDDKIKYSTRNLKGVKIINLDNINILDLITFDKILITEKSIDKLTELYISK